MTTLLFMLVLAAILEVPSWNHKYIKRMTGTENLPFSNELPKRHLQLLSLHVSGTPPQNSVTSAFLHRLLMFAFAFAWQNFTSLKYTDRLLSKSRWIPQVHFKKKNSQREIELTPGWRLWVCWRENTYRSRMRRHDVPHTGRVSFKLLASPDNYWLFNDVNE